MTAATLFNLANSLAVLSWVALGLAILFRRNVWRDAIELWLPLAFAALYTVLIVFFFGSAEGSFDSLIGVQKLFTSEWAALAGWVHFLSFDLLVGAWIAKQVMDRGQPRWLLIPLLPLTFMFGPIGYLAHHVVQLALSKSNA